MTSWFVTSLTTRCSAYGGVMELGISGRRAAVAAATSGLGLASATALAAEGVHVAICGRDPDRLAAAADAVGARVRADRCRRVDTGRRGRLRRRRDRSAGWGRHPGAQRRWAAAGHVRVDTGRRVSAALELNLLSVVAMCKAAVPAMQERQWGRVVAITSLSVRQPIAQLILSNTARAGATGFLKTLALEVSGDGVTVNSVQPGLHRTPRVTDLYSDEQQASMRMGDAADFGQVVAFLCGEPAKFTTGVQLHVDGGNYLGLL